MKALTFSSFLFVFVLLFLANTLFSKESMQENDSTIAQNLGENLKQGRFSFHHRTFYMQTINKGELMDYSTLATGAGIGYFSPSWKGFHVGFSGFFVFQLFQQNIYKPDPITSNVNRYEIVLYDMNDAENRRDLDRLEELYVSYEHRKSRLIYGRHKFQSPLLNEQDNRMRPNIFNGIQFHHKAKNWQAHAAWLNAVTIRGTVDWYSISSSYGVYPFGRNPQGTPSDYKGNVSSAGIGIAGFSHVSSAWNMQVWNYFNENVFNLSFVQLERKWNKGPLKWEFGAQGLFQTALNQGGNPNPEKAYIQPGEQSVAYGAKIQANSKKNTFSLNYFGIASNGRFLFPREWGREQFFASLPRERFEGNGNLNAFTLKWKSNPFTPQLSAQFGASVVQVAKIDNAAFNKYGLPSYYHFSADFSYAFKGYLSGFNSRLLTVFKPSQNPAAVPDVYRINRVDLWNLNLVIDYMF